MTDTPTPSENDPLADALRGARADVDPISGDSLVAAVRQAKGARSRQRRRARTGALGAVAALLLVAVAAVVLHDRSSSQLLKAGKQSASANSVAFGVVMAAPSTGLTDGQTVTVSVMGFDAGTEVKFVECATTSGERAVGGGAAEKPSDVGSGAHTDPTESATPPDKASPNSDGELLPSWRCPDYSMGSASWVTTTAAVPSVANSEMEDGRFALATTTLRIASSTDGFIALGYPTGVFSISAASKAIPSGACVNPVAVPPTAASDGGSMGNSDGSFPRAPTTFNSPSDESSPPSIPDPNGACVIIAMGKVAGKPRMFSSRALSFADAPIAPSSSVPSPIVPPSSSVPPSSVPSTSVAPPVYQPHPCKPGSTGAECEYPCPVSPPVASPADGNNSTPLLDFTPTIIAICHYPGDPTKPAATITDAPTIRRITSALEALRAPSPGGGCTAEMGPSIAIVADAGPKRTAIVAQFYGCGIVSNGMTTRFGAKDLNWIYALPGAG